MNNALKYVQVIIIVALIGYVMFLRECTTPKVITNNTVDTIYRSDSVYVPRIVERIVPKIYYNDTGSTKYLVDTLLLTDTAYIILDWNTEYIYKDTLLNNKDGFVSVIDTIYRNKIKSRQKQIKLYSQRIEPINHYYLGLGVSGSPDRFGLSANIGLITKRNNLYTIGYDVLNKDVYLNLYWRIR